MKKSIRAAAAHVYSLRLQLRSIPHVIVVLWRQMGGSSYYFRDRPDWFVNYIAEAAIKEVGEEEVQLAVVLEARAERKRRVERKINQIAAISPELAERLKGIEFQIGGDKDAKPK